MDLSSDQLTCLQIAFDEFDRTGNWPEFRAVVRQVSRKLPGVDARGLLTDLPWGLAVNNGADHLPFNLTVLGISQCSGSQGILSFFLYFVRVCVDRYYGPQDAHETPTISAEYLTQHNLFPDWVVKKIGRLLSTESWFLGSGSGPNEEGDGWSYEILDGIFRFRDVETIDQYLEITVPLRKTPWEQAVSLPLPPDAQVFSVNPLPQRSTELCAILIADIRGYTRFTKERGDGAAAELTARFRKMATEVVVEYEGRLVSQHGDEAVALFWSARQAILAALELQSRIAAERNAQVDFPFQIGIGIDIGEPVRVDDDIAGDAVILASRLCKQAKGDQVLTTPWVRHAARPIDGATYEDAETLDLKGFPEPVTVVQITSEPSQ